MRFSLINPNWTFTGSIYFGCREPHLPLEFGYSRSLLEREGHDVAIVDGQMQNLSLDEICRAVKRFQPDFTVIATAPSYLFWRCPPPELRAPRETLLAIRSFAGTTVVVGPHASTTPRTTLSKLEVDIAVRGECEEALTAIAAESDWSKIPSVSYRREGEICVQGGPAAVDMARLPPLRWTPDYLARHRHHHHRFDAQPAGPGAEIESTRGCPYRCTFCAKDNFRNLYRKRPRETVLEELDHLIAGGVEYVYFVDEIFLPDRELLEALRLRPVKFGVQLRIDHWNEQMLELLGLAGCVSIEAGVESITAEGRSLLDKKCRLSTEELTARLLHAKKLIPFVQANMLESKHDDREKVEQWRLSLQRQGIWANKPVPLFPYPGSPDYTRRWGPPDDQAWERAHAHYLEMFERFSNIQEERSRPLGELEQACCFERRMERR